MASSSEGPTPSETLGDPVETMLAGDGGSDSPAVAPPELSTSSEKHLVRPRRPRWLGRVPIKMGPCAWRRNEGKGEEQNAVAGENDCDAAPQDVGDVENGEMCANEGEDGSCNASREERREQSARDGSHELWPRDASRLRDERPSDGTRKLATTAEEANAEAWAPEAADPAVGVHGADAGGGASSSTPTEERCRAGNGSSRAERAQMTGSGEV